MSNSTARNRAAQSLEPLEGRRMLSTTPNDPWYRLMWGMEAINVEAAWDKTTGQPSVVVADIDTGIDYKHPDLYLNVWINQGEIPAKARRRLRDVDRDGRISFWDLNSRFNRGKTVDVNGNHRIDPGDLLASSKRGGWADRVNGKGFSGDKWVDDIVGWDFADNDNDPFDHDGHGTHTAGTIGAVGNNALGLNGVAWKVSIMPVKIFTDDGDAADDRDIADAIVYSAKAGARVSNNSWGGGYSSEIEDAIDTAGDYGQLFVAAAGNDSTNNDWPFFGTYPAKLDLDNVISVAATDENGELAYFSNYGDDSVDLAAPGEDIYSTYPGGDYKRMSGTSMATPHVTGAIALMWSYNPRWKAGQVKDRLANGADRTSDLADEVSDGMLNVNNAIEGERGVREDGDGGGGDGGGGIFPPIPLPFSVRSVSLASVDNDAVYA